MRARLLESSKHRSAPINQIKSQLKMNGSKQREASESIRHVQNLSWRHAHGAPERPIQPFSGRTAVVYFSKGKLRLSGRRSRQ